MEVQIDKNLYGKENINNTTPFIGTGREGEVKRQNTTNPFIEANTIDVSLSHIKNDCIIPVFAKDNEQTIAHQEFIEVALNVVTGIFKNEVIDEPEVRVSHQIKGRTPDAIHIPAKDLVKDQKTLYYERMAFLIRIPSITNNINGNDLSLSIGGVRAYNRENLFSKKKMESFKFFIGFQNMLCCNLCISTDGYLGNVKASSYQELQKIITDAIHTYRMEEHYRGLSALDKAFLNEKQFAQLLGKVKLFNFLPKQDKLQLPELLLNDQNFNTVARDYYQDKSFCKNSDGNISLWNTYNLVTGANKSSYIDTFLDRGVNAFDFVQGLSKAISGDSNYRWFLS